MKIEKGTSCFLKKTLMLTMAVVLLLGSECLASGPDHLHRRTWTRESRIGIMQVIPLDSPQSKGLIEIVECYETIKAQRYLGLEKFVRYVRFIGYIAGVLLIVLLLSIIKHRSNGCFK